MKTATRKPPKAQAAALAPLPAGTVLLALDCSSTAIGWAVFRGSVFGAAGLAKSPAGWISARRIRANADDVIEIIGAYGITRIAIEWQGPLRAAGGRNVNGLAVLGQAQGYLLARIEREFPQVKIDLIGEREWTRIGGWNIPKQKRAERIKLLVPEYREAVGKNPRLDPGLDLADALGIALYRLSI